MMMAKVTLKETEGREQHLKILLSLSHMQVPWHENLRLQNKPVPQRFMTEMCHLAAS